MDFPGDIDDFTLPLMAWLWHNQPDLLLNLKITKMLSFQSPSMTTTVPIFFAKSRSGERVKVSRDEDGTVHAEHLPEPKPRIPSSGGDWHAVFEDVTWETAV